MRSWFEPPIFPQYDPDDSSNNQINLSRSPPLPPGVTLPSSTGSPITDHYRHNFPNYYQYWESQVSTVSLLCFYVTVFISMFASVLLNITSPDKSNQIFVRFIFFIPLLLHVYILVQKGYPNLPRLPIPTVYLCDANIIILTGLLGFSLIQSSFMKQCPYPNCISIQENSLQPNILLALFTSTIISPVALKVHHSWAAFLSYLICLVSSLISAIIVRAPTGTYRMLVVCLIMLFLVLYDYERSLKKLYLDNMNLSDTMLAKLEIENEKKLVQLKSDEMRVLIGNVAHDLKSPLQSFLCELDSMLDFSTSAIQSSFQISTTSVASPLAIYSIGEKSENSRDFFSLHVNMIESVILLKSICSFMAMLINRAVDFSKVSSGFKLQPRDGTMNINEVMKWVIQCTSNSLNGVPVEFLPLPPNMCNQIVTDPQWFSENLLCLVSNAQKFTTEGVIVISCQLIPRKECSLTPLGSTSSNQSRSYFRISHRLSSSLDGVGSEEFMILVEVEDEGVGIPVNKRADLFQPFKQAQKQAGGTGLGLFSLSKRVESLGGNCGISDRRDGKRGCRFWFTVPYRPSDESATSLEGIVEPRDQVYSMLSQISRTESRVNEVMSMLADRSARNSLGSSRSRAHSLIHDQGGNPVRDRSSSLRPSYGSSHEDSEAHDLESVNDDAKVDTRRYKVEKLPIVPSYIRINASVRAYNHNNISLEGDSRIPSPHRHYLPESPKANSEKLDGNDDLHLDSFREQPSEIDNSKPSTRHHQQSFLILLVEDSPLIQKTLSRALIRQGYEVDVVWNGEECLKKVMESKNHYDVILMDIQMPVMDGLEACRRLRTMEKEGKFGFNVISGPISCNVGNKRVGRVNDLDTMEKGEENDGAEVGCNIAWRHLIIGISANGDDTAKAEALNSGMDDFLPKPVSIQAFKDCLISHKSIH